MKKKHGLSFYQKEKKMKPETWKEIGSYTFWIAAVLLLAAVIVLCVGIRTSIIGVSMEPTLNDGQEILINKVSYLLFSPQRNDVIVFRPNGNEYMQFYVKRVIGLPGETVQIKGGSVYIDGVLLEEEIDCDLIKDAGMAKDAYLLGEDEYFVLGDNRNNSEDSRSGNIGSVNREDIEGQAWFCLTKGNVGFGFIE